MKFRTLIRRSLRFHWRSHLGVVLGAAIGSAALIGALVVGDSVRGSLMERALMRVGQVHYTLWLRDRSISTSLAESFYQPLPWKGSNSYESFSTAWECGGLLEVTGTMMSGDGDGRANAVSIFGDASKVSRTPGDEPQNFWAFSPRPRHDFEIQRDEVWLNRALADQVGVKTGDTVILRFDRQSTVSAEVAITTRSASRYSLRLQVAGVLGPEQFGDLSFIPKASLPLNAFVNQHQLQEALDLGSRVNVVVLPSLELNRISDWTGGRLWTLAYKLLSKVGKQDLLFSGHGKVQASQYALGVIHEMLRTKIQLADIDCRLDEVEPKSFELRTPRVFLDPPIERAATNSETGTQPILTYLATLLHAGTNATPYSMVTAAGAPWTPAGLRDDEVVVSQWLADDLHVKPGDEIAVSYFLPESGAKLEEATNTFRVHSVVPLEMPWADRTLMPDFPGIEKAESTRDWDAGFPLTYKIRPKDEDYWKQYRGTSKAFITLAAGQRMWGNRFGNLTAIRFPIPTNLIGSTLALTPALSPWEREDRPQSSGKTETGDSSAAPEKSKTSQPLSPLPGGEGQGEGERHKNSIEDFRAALEKKILANLKPEELGLRFEPVREQALKAAKESQDFGGLFLGFSCFLIAAALLLMAMLFQFGLEQRAPEIGTLLALGFTPKQVRKLLLREGVAQAFIGGVLGAVGGIYFAKAMLHGLNTQWNEAVGGMSLSFHMTAQTLVIGLSASVAVSGATLWLTLRKFVQREPRDLLVGEVGEVQSRVRSPKVRAFAVVSLAGGLAVVAWAVTTGNTANAGAFFGAGALVLIAGLGFVSGRLATGAPISRLVRTDTGHPQADQEIGAPITLGSLALCSCARRRKRSLGTVAMLACGSFLIVSIGVFRLDANRDATERSSGTGGFALIGETTMPVVHDLNSQSGRDFFALSEVDLQGVNIVAFRVREGDEASCLNLNAAQKPRLLGVKPELMAGRFAFAKDLNEKTKAGPWAALQREHLSVPLETNEIPAIGDANSIQWAMKKKVGDTIDYVDERGQPFKVRIVGAVANSILQGQLIIDEAEFVQRFPGEAGYRMFLLDAPTNRVAEVSATLSRALQDVGLELTPAPQRLAQFNAVQNTYLGTFQVLGGLGLLLGSVGLGIVVLRNVLERRGELAVLMAVGFRKTEVQRLLLLENGALLAAGLGVGVIAAAVAVLPAVLSPETRLPVGSLAATLIAILVNGLLWTWLATRLAVRGDLLRALRNE